MLALGTALQTFLRLCLGLVFLTSGLSKLGNRSILWVGLGFTEAGAGGSVLLGWRLPWGSGIMAGLLLMFTAYLAFLVRKNVRKKCGCGGVLGDALVGKALLLRNGVLLGATAVLLILSLYLPPPYSPGLDLLLSSDLRPHPAAWAGAALGLALGLATVALYLRFRPKEL